MSLNDDHELKKARQTLLNRIGRQSFFRFNFYAKIISSLGATEYQYGIIELHDDIVSRLVSILCSIDYYLFDL
jgi:hypothetical protein